MYKIDRLVDFILKFRWYIVIIIPLITFTLASQLKHLEFEGSYRIWFDEQAKIITDYDDFRKIFGNDDAATIMFQDNNATNGVFNKKALGVVHRITEALWQTKYVARVDSITNFQYVHTDKEYPDEIIVENFFEDEEQINALTQTELLEKKEQALAEESIRGRIISEDASTTMIVARLVPKAGDDKNVPMILPDLLKEIIALEKESGYTFYLNGGPVINRSFIDIAQHDASTYTPLVLLIVFILLYSIFRRSSVTLMSMAVVFFTFIIVLASQVMLGYKLNNFTANIPVFVVAIGIADSMHLLWVYMLARKQGLDSNEAIHYSVKKNLLAIFLTSLTTAIGFASLGISNVVPVKTLGIATATAAILAFFLTILFIPALLGVLNLKVKEHELKKSRTKDFAKIFSHFIVNNDKKILLSFILLATLLGAGLFKVQIDSNTAKYFADDVPFKISNDFLQEHLNGPMSYEIVVDSKEKDGIKEPEFLKTVQKFSDEFQEKYADVRHVSSLLDIVKQFNRVLNHTNSVPESKELIAQYLLLYSLSLPQGMEINDRMDIDERLLRVTASVNVVDTSVDLEMIAWAEEWWKDTAYEAHINGQTQMFAHMYNDVTATLINSISLAIVLISIVMLLIFKNLKLLPIFILPNVLPIAMVLGFMGWLTIHIDLGVAVSGAIILGVAVDDTIHFLVKYLEAKREGMSVQEAIEYVMHYAGSAIIFTTIILSSAFLIFTLSSFNPNFYFGVVTTTALLIAMYVDLVLLPALFSYLNKKGLHE